MADVNVTSTLKNMLSEFFISEIGAEAFSGVTYALFDAETDQVKIDRYSKIRNEATNCGFTGNQLFRKYQLNGGCIFDIDLSTAIELVNKIANGAGLEADIIKDIQQNVGPETLEIREKSIKKLADLAIKNHENGVMEFEVALFSRASTDRITVTGKLANGQISSIIYPAFVARIADIELVNRAELQDKGFVIGTVTTCEILPNKKGLAVILKLKDIKK